MNRQLRQAAEWIVYDLGYPFDFGSDIPPPPGLREAMIAAVLADPEGIMHGGDLDRAGVEAWIRDECPGFFAPYHEDTP